MRFQEADEPKLIRLLLSVHIPSIGRLCVSTSSGDETAIAEERHLTLSRATSRTKWGRRKLSPPSRFLFEMCSEAEVEEMLAEEESDSDSS